MALNIEDSFPGKSNPANTEYPFGSARNVTVPGDGTGTPFVADILNDLFGFQQGLLAAAGLNANGLPDSINNSQYLDALNTITLGELAKNTGAAEIGTASGNDIQTELDALSDGQTGGLIVFTTFAILSTYTPANPQEERSSYKVTSDPDPTLNGFYSWVTGTTYVKDASLVTNVLDPLDTNEAVSGKAVADYTTVQIAESAISIESGKAFSVIDELGNVLLEVDAEGELRTSKIETDSEKFEVEPVAIQNESRGFQYSVRDILGNVLFGVDDLGKFVADIDVEAAPEAPGRNYDFNINHYFCYGQSLSVGQALPVQTTSQAYDNLMFFRGMRPQYDYPLETPAQWYASLQPAIEEQSTEEPSLGETPCSGSGDMIKQLILDEDGISFTQQSYQIMLSAPGFGALTIAELSKGSVHYDRLIDQVGNAKTLSNAQGKTYAAQAFSWLQGESDYLDSTPQATYKAAMIALYNDLNFDIKAASGQSKDVAMISYQIATSEGSGDPQIALAQLEAAEETKGIYIACAMYQFDYTDVFHLTGVSSKWVGAYLGMAYKRIIIDQENWLPLQPTGMVVQDNIAALTFNVPHGKLVFDTTEVAAAPDMGFEIVDNLDASVAITSVTITGENTLNVVAAVPLVSGFKIRYAFTGAGQTGRLTGPRGNLRDTQGDDINIDINGDIKRLDNWCLIFEKEVL